MNEDCPKGCRDMIVMSFCLYGSKQAQVKFLKGSSGLLVIDLTCFKFQP